MADSRAKRKDPDNPPLTDNELARFRPAADIDPELVARYRKTRGKQKKPTKIMTSLRLDADVLAALKAEGPGWQTRLNDRLRAEVLGD